MTPTASSPIPTAAARPAAAARRPWLAAAALGAAAGLVWWGGAAAAAAGAVLATLGGAALGRGGIGPAAAAPAPAAGRLGAEVMVSQVVPVWSRQMECTRDAANDGLSHLLQTFSEMSGTLTQLTHNLSTLSVTAQPGAVDGALRSEAPALQALLAASERAFAERDAAVEALGSCAAALAPMQQLAKQAREIARHTRLVAFNASIEARRSGGDGEGGAQAVAGELRTLASRMADTGEQIERGVLGLIATVRKHARAGELGDTTPDELRLEIELRARQALTTLLATLGASLQGSAQVQEASTALRAQIDAAFIDFQFGDRVSQMMSIVATDMSNFARWVAANPRATQSDAAAWLAALESSYTMEEQRSQHHGNVHVERSTGVEFF